MDDMSCLPLTRISVAMVKARNIAFVMYSSYALALSYFVPFWSVSMNNEARLTKLRNGLGVAAGELTKLAGKITEMGKELTIVKEALASDANVGKEKERLDKKLAALSAELDGVRTHLDFSTWSLRRLENLVQLSVAVVLCALGVASLYCGLNCLALATAIVVDGFVLLLLFEIAVRTSIRRPFTFELAHRAYFILIFFFLLTALVSSFGQLYLGAGGVKKGCEQLATAPDAAYFSAVTIMTLGYGDFVPTTSPSRWLVLGELGSGAMLLLLIVPVLASRLALLGEGHDD
jgi:hypothetical protein